MQWRCRHRTIDLTRPVVMGILNVTPDSFSDGNRYATVDAALERAARIAEEGAAIIDVGGESTRPGAQGVDEAGEIARVVPGIEGRAAASGISREAIVPDPGVGCGKGLAHNPSLLRDLPRIAVHRAPVLGGVSRKSFMG